MADKKSIIEEAILDIKKIQDALNANTREILRSASREEIDSVVKESLMAENEFSEEDVDKEPEETETTTDEPTADGGEVKTDDIEIGDGSDKAEDDIDISTDVEPETGIQDLGMDADASLGDEMDMTAASDDDVIAIYKKLSGNDEIEIVGDEIHLNVSEPGEYVIKTDDLGGEATADDFGGEGSLGDEPGELGADTEDDLVPVTDEPDEFGAEATEDDENLYEITMEEDDAVTEDQTMGSNIKDKAEDDNATSEPIEEAIPVGLAQSKRLPGKVDIGQPRGAGAKQEGKTPVKTITEGEIKYNKLLTESTKLKAENEDFRKALKKFRDMLVETVVYNTNLTYVTRLFTEHSITKDEKKLIISRFDSEVTNLPESKKLYKTIVNELNSKKTIKESIDNKITNTVTTSVSKQLNENTAYVDPSIKRIKELMNLKNN